MSHSLNQHLVIFATDVFRLCVWLALLSAVFVTLERLFALRPSRILRPGVAADLGYYFLSSLLPGALLAAPLGLLAGAAQAAMPGTWHAQMAALPMWAHMAAVFLVMQVGAYWGHRWSHELPWLWRFHAIHHSAEHMDWLVNTRAHPVDMVFERICSLVPLSVLGLAGPGSGGAAASLAPAIVVVVGTVWGFFIHANLRWRLGPLEWLVATPAFHHWHHTNDTENRDRNYAAMLPVLDRVFGTLHLPRHWPEVYGVDAPVGGTLVQQIVGPLVPDRPARQDSASRA